MGLAWHYIVPVALVAIGFNYALWESLGVLFVVGLGTMAYLFQCFVIVPPRHVAIVERLGHYRRVLWPGHHFLQWPMETLHWTRWTYPGQDGKPRVLHAQMITFDNSQMDIPPLHCTSSDNVPVTVDGTLMYNVSKPEVAVYATDDALNLLYQCSTQALHNVIASIPSAALHGQDNDIGRRVCDYINSKMDERGLHCNEFIIQQTDIDPAARARFEEVATKRREAEMRREHQLAEQVCEMEQLEHRRHLLEAQQALELSKANHAIDLAKLEAIQRSSTYAGWTIDQQLQLRQIEALAKTKNRVIVVPESGFNLHLKK